MISKRHFTVLVTAVIIIVIAFSFSIVPAGHTGVRLTMGRVSGVVGEGLNIKVPFIQNIIKIDNRILKTTMDTESFSKDLQTVKVTLAVNYRVNTEKSHELYQNIGTKYEEVVIAPSVSETMKGVCAQYTADELVANRKEVGNEINDILTGRLKGYGLTVTAVNIVEFDFTEEFIKAIEQKQVAQQNALKAEQDLQRIKIEAEQRVAQASAEAESYRLQSQQLTENMVKAKWIEKWDGKLPEVQAGDGGAMILNLKN